MNFHSFLLLKLSRKSTLQADTQLPTYSKCSRTAVLCSSDRLEKKGTEAKSWLYVLIQLDTCEDDAHWRWCQNHDPGNNPPCVDEPKRNSPFSIVSLHLEGEWVISDTNVEIYKKLNPQTPFIPSRCESNVIHQYSPLAFAPPSRGWFHGVAKPIIFKRDVRCFVLLGFCFGHDDCCK